MFQPLALAMMDEAGYNGIEDEHIEKLAVFFRMLSRNFILPEICRHVFFCETYSILSRDWNKVQASVI